MRVAVYHSNDDLRLEERPRPTLAPGELLLRVEASGICGSDVLEWYRRPRAPLVLGHEIAGDVVEAGAGVTRFAPGDRVVATHHVPCNTCRYCRSDRHSVCETLHRTTFEPGGFSELVRLPAINVELGTLHLPADVSYEEGSFVEPLACTVRGQRLAGVRAGDSVAVLGSGVAGLLHIQLARACGAGPVFASDVVASRLDAARRAGADGAFLAGPDLVEQVRAANDGRLVDRVLVCTAAAPAMEQATRLVDLGGSILYFAPMPPGSTLALPMHDLWRRGITITHSYAGPPADMRAALELIEARRVDVASLITHRLPLAEAGRGFHLVAEARDCLKVMLRPQL